MRFENPSAFRVKKNFQDFAGSEDCVKLNGQSTASARPSDLDRSLFMAGSLALFSRR
jgi:hypothetical protein